MHGVFPHGFEHCFKLVPQDLVGFHDGVCSTGSFCLKGGFLGIDPSINVWAAHIRECINDSAEWVGHDVDCSVQSFVVFEFA